jgi:hypothetical protein
VVCILSQINQIHISQSCFFKIYFNIILSCMSRPFWWSVSFRFSYQNAECTFLLSRVCYMP